MELPVKRAQLIERNKKSKRDRNALVVGKHFVEETSLKTATRLV
jgi:hypothetical protein